MKNKTLISLFIFFQLIVTTANANSCFFDQRYRGWLWFEEKELVDSQEQELIAPTIEQMLQAKKDNEEFSKELELLRQIMIRYPEDIRHVVAYKRKEKEMQNRASALGKNWLMANFLNPEIVDELKHPQNIYGRKIFTDEQIAQNSLDLKNLAGQVELYVFRMEGCPYCLDLEKHLNNFAKKYGFTVEAVTPDQSNSQYFKTHSSPELIKALQLEVMPTVIAVISDTRERFELARGAVSVADLEDKAILLVNHLRQKQIINPLEENK
jgi:conjugal transfer pilus assembly protein TraF